MDRARRRALFACAGWPRLYAAATLARLANDMFTVAVVLLVLDRTGSAALAGATVAAVTLPSLVSGPVLGAWLDRMRHRGALLAADQAIMVVALAGIVLAAGHAPGGVVLGLALLAGVTFPLSTAGFTTLLPSFVPRELLSGANALEASSYNLAIVGGPALAGLLAAAGGPELAVAVEGAMKLASLALIAGLREPRRAVASAGRSVARSVREGFALVYRTPALLAVTFASAIGMAGRGLLVLAFPLFAAGALGSSREAGGFLWAALAVGSITGALNLTRLERRHSPEAVVLGALACGGAVMLLWPLAGTLAVAMALVAAGGLALGPGLGAQLSVRQARTPADLHGQIFMTGASMKVGSFALGAALAGPAVTGLGAPETLALAGGAQILGFGTGLALLVGRGARGRGAAVAPTATARRRARG